MSRIILFGLGRGADVAYRFFKRDTSHEICGFAVDEKYRDRDSFHDLPVVPFETVEQHFPPGEFQMFVLLGYQEMNGLRARKYQEAKKKGYALASYVCSDIFQAEKLAIGENCFILDNQSISLDVKIGNNVVMWSSNHIGDLSHIGDHAWVSSHVTVAAEVNIGERAFLGLGATISNRVTLAPGTFVGAATLVTADTAENSVKLQGGASFDDSAAFMKVLRVGGKL